MMKPWIGCVCLTADRQRLTDRAVRCFRAQTYERRWLLILDTGVEPYDYTYDFTRDERIVIKRDPTLRGKRIGALRNVAASLSSRADILAHWDSDDVSHPERLFLQFEDLMAYSATGFSNMLFFDSRPDRGNAWEYTYSDRRLVMGSSLMYWYKTWKAVPFDETKFEGEEKWWPSREFGANGTNGVSPKPLLIADYHGGNTGSYGKSVASNTPPIFDQTPAQRAHNPQYRRAPEWDEYCREVMTWKVSE